MSETVSSLGEALVIGLGRSGVPAVEKRLAADGYRVAVVGGDAAIAELLAGPPRTSAATVIAAALPPRGGVAEVDVAQVMDALDRSLAVAGQVAKRLYTEAPPPRPSRLVFVLDWAAGTTPDHAMASAVMGGMLGLARSWSLEFAPLGVAVNAVVAGPDAGDDPRSDPSEDYYLIRRPTADDVAHAVAFFLDPRSDAITGQALLVCGGRTAGRLTF
ncbi:MAG: SDR family oxidoreductase [Alphaproteobacteria bacterium]